MENYQLVAKTATLTLKRSTAAGAVPAAGSIQQAEPAINLADRKLYSKDAAGSVFQVAPSMAEYLRMTSDPRKDLLKMGVRGDGDPAFNSDNSAIIAQALAEMPADPGGELYFGPGVFSCAFPKVTNKMICISGRGREVTRLVLTPTSSGHGMQIDQGARGYLTRVHDLAIIARGPAAGAGLLIKYQQELTADLPGPIVENVSFRGYDLDTDAWSADILLQDAWLFHIAGCHFRGAKNIFAGDAIRLVGACTDGTVMSNWAVFRDQAVKVSGPSLPYGASEGANIIDNRFVAVNYGVVADDGAGYPDIKVAYNHINARRAGVKITNRPQIDVSHNLIYRWWGGEIDTWYGVLIQTACQDAIVAHNKIYGFNSVGTVPTLGVYVQNSNGGIIDSNVLVAMDTGVDLGGNSKAVVGPNNVFRSVDVNIFGVPAGALVRDNVSTATEPVASYGNLSAFDGVA